MNLPNKLTVLRVIMIPFFLLFYFVTTIQNHMLFAFLIFAIAALTDMLDGKIARKHNLITNFGKLMDPLADKLLVTAAMICILTGNYLEYTSNLIPLSVDTVKIINVIILIIIMSRDLIINSIRMVAASEGIVIAADILGKIKTVLQMVWLSVSLLNKWLFALYAQQGMTSTTILIGLNILSIIEIILYVGMFAMTVVSGINYVKQNKGMFADA